MHIVLENWTIDVSARVILKPLVSLSEKDQQPPSVQKYGDISE